MAKIDKQFDYLNLIRNTEYDYLDKKQNVNNNIIYMLNRSNVMFKYHDLPDTIPETELEKLLQTYGFAIVGKINGELYALNGGLGGEGDVYNQPTKATVSVPYLKFNATWDINTDCVIVSNDSHKIGLLPMFAKYCTLMNENEITMLLATVNKRIQNLLSANDDNTIESAKLFLRDVFDGKLGIIGESKLFDSLKVANNSNNTNVSMKDLFEYEQYLKATMFNEIGLNANFNMKRERLTSAEVETNSDNLYPLVDDMLAHRRKAVEKINEMFDTNITVEFNSSWDYRTFNGESIHNVEEEVNINELSENEETETDNKNVDNIVDNVESPETNNDEDSEQSEPNEPEGETNNDEDGDQSEPNEPGDEETEDNPETDNEDEEKPM